MCGPYRMPTPMKSKPVLRLTSTGWHFVHTYRSLRMVCVVGPLPTPEDAYRAAAR